MFAQTDSETAKPVYSEVLTVIEDGGFAHWQLSNGIHVLEFRDYSQQTIEKCATSFEIIFLSNPPNQTVRVLADVRPVQILSLPPVISLTRQILETRSSIPPVAVAVVHDRRGFYVAFAGLVIRLAAFYQTHARVGNDYDEALTWLTSFK
jgi:hypothetical protein